MSAYFYFRMGALQESVMFKYELPSNTPKDLGQLHGSPQKTHITACLYFKCVDALITTCCSVCPQCSDIKNDKVNTSAVSENTSYVFCPFKHFPQNKATGEYVFFST